MSARTLAWYISGMLSLVSLMMLFVSVAPAAETRFAVLQAIVGGVNVGFGLFAVFLTVLPGDHWLNRSKAVRYCLSIAAVAVSLFAATSMG